MKSGANQPKEKTMSISITKYNRKSENKYFIRDVDNGKQYFAVILYGDAGRYWVCWQRQTVEIRNDFISTMFTPFDDENGRGDIKYARFSKSFLEKCDKVIENNMEKYYNLWANQTNHDLFMALYNDLNAIK